MTQVASRGAARRKRHDRIRLRVEGSASRPRLAVFRSNIHIYAQVIDDGTGRTLAAASTVEKELRGSRLGSSCFVLQTVSDYFLPPILPAFPAFRRICSPA